jgi:signal transduction histidine kinase
MVREARTLAEAVEHEVSGTIRTLQALAESERLDRGDLEAFHAEARRAARAQPTWLTVLLLSPDGRQLVNSSRPYGERLSSVNEPESLRQVVETGSPAVGDLALGQMRKWAFPVRVPVKREGELRYVLTAVITPEALADIIKDHSFPEEEWTRTVVDGRGVVVARTREPERFVGQKGTPAFLRRISEANEGVFRNTTLDNAEVYLAFSRTGRSRWTSAVAVPVEFIERPARRAMWLVVGTGLLLLMVSCVGALVLSWRISRGISLAAAAAGALAKGERPSVTPSSIREVAELGEAIQHSSRLLAQRGRERDEHLARAEAARAEAEEANRLKDEFLATLSHELRTPLTAILGWAKLLREGQLDARGTERAVEVIERNAQTQARLVEDLLDTSRVITGKLRLEMQPVELTAIVENVFDSVRPAAEAKGVELDLQLEGKVPRVFGDQNRLQQVVWNLLSNAVKFTPKGGRVVVGLKAFDSQVELFVRDTGVGISADFLPYVFDRFRQADGSTTRRHGGLGLGLAIVRHLVELHGGTVSADSAGEGKGTAFAVRLPLDGARAANGEARAQGVSARVEDAPVSDVGPQPLRGVRVLVVDDEPDTREMISAALVYCEAEVRACGSAAEAFGEVIAWEPDVIISDIGMPYEDGYDFIRMVREWEGDSGRRIPAAALTALARAEDRARALASGYQVYISKPVEPSELIATVSRLLSLKN